MVFLVFTRAGFEQAKRAVSGGQDAIWVNAGVLTEEETRAVRQLGISLTSFTTAIDRSDGERLKSELETIAEHHPGETIWVEATSS